MLFAPLNHFLAAARFLTVIPLGPTAGFEPGRLTAWFPVVGLALGLMLAAVDTLAGRFWPVPAAAVLDVVFLAVITGALHLDGLADTADGLYGQWSRERALAIMKDSRIGPMGVVAVIGCLALKWAGIAGLQMDRSLVLILVPAYARAAILIGMRCLPYARAEGGTGAPFFRRALPWKTFWAAGVLIGLSLLLQRRALLLNLGFGLIVGIVLIGYRRKINGITGDMLGALIEMTEAGLFFLLAGGMPS